MRFRVMEQLLIFSRSVKEKLRKRTCAAAFPVLLAANQQHMARFKRPDE